MSRQILRPDDVTIIRNHQTGKILGYAVAEREPNPCPTCGEDMNDVRRDDPIKTLAQAS
jgi:hypothetical protein